MPQLRAARCAADDAPDARRAAREGRSSCVRVSCVQLRRAVSACWWRARLSAGVGRMRCGAVFFELRRFGSEQPEEQSSRERRRRARARASLPVVASPDAGPPLPSPPQQQQPPARKGSAAADRGGEGRLLTIASILALRLARSFATWNRSASAPPSTVACCHLKRPPPQIRRRKAEDQAPGHPSIPARRQIRSRADFTLIPRAEPAQQTVEA